MLLETQVPHGYNTDILKLTCLFVLHIRVLTTVGLESQFFQKGFTLLNTNLLGVTDMIINYKISINMFLIIFILYRYVTMETIITFHPHKLSSVKLPWHLANNNIYHATMKTPFMWLWHWVSGHWLSYSLNVTLFLLSYKMIASLKSYHLASLKCQKDNFTYLTLHLKYLKYNTRMNPSKKCKRKPFFTLKKKYMKRKQKQPTKLNVVFSSSVPKGKKNETNKQIKATTTRPKKKNKRRRRNK